MSMLGQRLPRKPVLVIIGGGVTGMGIAARAAKAGFKTTLVERGELGSGTSSHFHGILHSGARYAVSDPTTAAECYQENQKLRTVIPDAVTNTGGLFAAMSDYEANHADKVLAACQQAGIPTSELSVAQTLAQEPLLNRKLTRVFSVPDGFIDAGIVIKHNRAAADAHRKDTSFLMFHKVVGFRQNATRLTAVEVQDVRNSETLTIRCDYVINAAGVWAQQVGKLAGADIPMVFDKGTMITFKDMLTQAVINRCRPEADGDLLVPGNSGSIMGTTARVITDPDNCLPTQEEADVLLREGSILVPAMATAIADNIYCGVRPLIGRLATASGSSRGLSRSFEIIDHTQDGLSNFISVVGGKATLYDRMATAAVDHIKDGLPIRTARRLNRSVLRSRR